MTRSPQDRRAYVDSVREQLSVPVDIEADDLEREFAQCETRFICHIDLSPIWNGGLGVWYEQEVLFRDQWRTVGHTDLFDNMATGHCAPSEEQQGLRVDRLIPISYGARLHAGGGRGWHVSFITHMTDG